LHSLAVGKAGHACVCLCVREREHACVHAYLLSCSLPPSLPPLSFSPFLPCCPYLTSSRNPELTCKPRDAQNPLHKVDQGDGPHLRHRLNPKQHEPALFVERNRQSLLACSMVTLLLRLRLLQRDVGALTLRGKSPRAQSAQLAPGVRAIKVADACQASWHCWSVLECKRGQ
jgi:hypothetical protein